MAKNQLKTEKKDCSYCSSILRISFSFGSVVVSFLLTHSFSSLTLWQSRNDLLDHTDHGIWNKKLHFPNALWLEAKQATEAYETSAQLCAQRKHYEACAVLTALKDRPHRSVNHPESVYWYLQQQRLNGLSITSDYYCALCHFLNNDKHWP